jgi:hypothetical protein
MNVNIILPISPSHLLFTQIGSGTPPSNLNYSVKWSSYFRKIIIEHAYRYVYAISKQKGMLATNPRIVHKNLFEKMKKEIAGWHEEQTLYERAYR